MNEYTARTIKVEMHLEVMVPEFHAHGPKNQADAERGYLRALHERIEHHLYDDFPVVHGCVVRFLEDGEPELPKDEPRAHWYAFPIGGEEQRGRIK